MAGGSKTAVFAALGANAVVAVAKLGGFLFTGSGALLAEFVHSVADVGNQALLAVGLAQAERPPDDAHPDGYTREAFVWALISAVGLFFLGCGVSVYHAVEALLSAEGHAPEAGGVALGILAFSLVVEGGSGLVALRVVRQHAAQRRLGVLAHLRTTSDPFELAVLLEDGAAVLGVTVALVAVGLTTLTHVAIWDALGTLVIGLLLGAVALVLIRLNRDLLVGKGVADDVRERIDAVFAEDPAVRSVLERAGVVFGTDDVAIRAQLQLDGGYLADRALAEQDLQAVLDGLRSVDDLRAWSRDLGERVSVVMGDEIDRIEQRLREELPSKARIVIEPDRP